MFEEFTAQLKEPLVPAGAAELVRGFSPDDAPIAAAGRWQGDELNVYARGAGSVALFEVPIQGLEQCMFTYRLEISAQDLQSNVYLEMWCRVPGRGEFFSKGLNQKVRGTIAWRMLDVPFYLKKEQRPSLIKLKLYFQGRGEVRLRNIQLLATPLELSPYGLNRASLLRHPWRLTWVLLLFGCFFVFLSVLFIRGELHPGVSLAILPGLWGCLMGARRFLLKPQRREHGLCLRCGYSLKGIAEPRCPLCECRFDPEAVAAGQPQEHEFGIAAHRR